MLKIDSITLTLVVLSCPACFADMRMAARYTEDNQTTETTTYARDQRLRYQFGKDLTLLHDCAGKRIIQLDEKNKTFLSLPDAAAGPATVQSLTVSATGEQKEMFGHTARRLKTTRLLDGGQGRVETDGWYIDADSMPDCAVAADQKGAAGAGFPLSYTIATYKDGTQPSSTISMQVTELVEAPLDAALFEVPPGYTDAGKADAIQPAAAALAQKAPGAVRVAAVAIPNRPGQQPVSPAAFEHMMAQFKQSNLDVLPLAAGSAEILLAKARDAQCDYVLYTEIASLDKPKEGKAGKFGSLLRKAPMVGGMAGVDAYEAKVDYRLVPLGADSPALASTATAKTGSSFTFNWKTAVNIASTVTPMLMMARMMNGAFNPNMMKALTSGRGYGLTMTGMDPTMSTMSMFLQHSSMLAALAQQPGANPRAGANPNAADTALAAALDQEAKAVLAHLKK